MQVSVEDLSSVKKVMHIEVPSEEVARELDDAYRELGKTAKIKGFRPGKAPRSVLERHYRKSVEADVSQKLLQQSLVDALQETRLEVLGNPVLDAPPPVPDANEAYKYAATVEVKPELEDLDYKGLELVRTNYRHSEEEVENQLKVAQEKLTEKVAISEDRPARESDFVMIDYEAFQDGEPAPSVPRAENHVMRVGDAAIHEDLDKAIAGMEKGQSRSVAVSFPTDHREKALAGADIEFRVTLRDIREEKLQEIDDEFARKLGDFDTLEDLKAHIRSSLKEGYDKRIEQELNEQIFRALLERHDVDAPEYLVNLEVEQIVSDVEKRFEHSGRKMEDLGLSRESIAEKYRDTAEKQVLRHLLLGKLIVQEKLELADEEMETGYREMAEAFGQPADVLKKYYEMNKEQLEFFKHTLLEKKAVNLIIENSLITEKEPEPETDDEAKEEE